MDEGEIDRISYDREKQDGNAYRIMESRMVGKFQSELSRLNLSHASFRVLNTAPAIIRCSVVAVVGIYEDEIGAMLVADHKKG